MAELEMIYQPDMYGPAIKYPICLPFKKNRLR